MGDHAESVQIKYDPSKTSYSDLLKIFWTTFNKPRQDKSPQDESHQDESRQDKSRQYMSAIFYHNDEQRCLAEKSRDDEQRRLAEKSQDEYKKEKKKKTVEIIPAGTFYDAEPYHQKYLLRKELMLKVLSLTEDELIKSHTATALNGYAGGYGTTEGLEKELPKFIDNLPLYGRDLIKKVLAEAQRQE